jgi:PAS domain-containing protein
VKGSEGVTTVSAEQTIAKTSLPSPETRRLYTDNRLFAVLSAVNRAMTRKPGRKKLLQEICRILVEIGGFRMAWIGAPDVDGWIIPEAAFGDTLRYLSSIRVSLHDISQGRGPTGTAIRENRPIIYTNILANSAMHPWHALAVEQGFNSSACFPFRLPSGGIAGLNLYSTDCDFFSPDQEQLLVEISADISYALEFAATEEKRAEVTMQLERSQALAKVGGWSADLITGLSINSPQASRINGMSIDPVPWGRFLEIIVPEDLPPVQSAWEEALTSGIPYEIEHRIIVGGKVKWVHNLADLEYDDSGRPVRVSGMLKDITEYKRVEVALEEKALLLQQEIDTRLQSEELLLDVQRQFATLNLELEERVEAEVIKNREKDQSLMQSEKLASIGQLAAGVAHEINNPMAYISSNLTVLEKYFIKILSFDRFQQEQCRDLLPVQIREAIADGRRSHDMEYLLEDGADLIREMVNGAERVTRIVENLKSYSRVDRQEFEYATLSNCLDCVLRRSGKSTPPCRIFIVIMETCIRFL